MRRGPGQKRVLSPVLRCCYREGTREASQSSDALCPDPSVRFLRRHTSCERGCRSRETSFRAGPDEFLGVMLTNVRTITETLLRID